MIDDGVPAVGGRDALVDQALVQAQVWQWPALVRPVGGSGYRSCSVVGPTHESCGVLDEAIAGWPRCLLKGGESEWLE